MGRNGKLARRRAHTKGKANGNANNQNKQDKKRIEDSGRSFMDVAAYWVALASVIPFALFGVFYSSHKTPAIVLFGVGVMCLTVAGCLYWINAVTPKPSPETDVRGVLIPANDPTPATHCDPGIPPAAMRVYFGDSVSWITNTELSPYPLLIMGDEVVVSIERATDGIYLNANIRSEDGRFIAKIDKNEFWRNANNSWYQERDDKSTLEVYDERGQVVLYVRYLNPSSIKMLGTFHSEGRYIKIEDNQMVLGPNQTMAANCFGDNRSFALKIK